MNIRELSVEPREAVGKGAVGRLRREGLVPAILYGGGSEPVRLAVKPTDVHRALHGHDAGGVLALLMRAVEVSCLPSLIPERIDVDVSALRIYDVATVADLQLPEGVRVTTPASQPVATVAPPMVEEVVAAAVAPAAEPEVVTERKPKEEEEAKGKDAKEEGKAKK